MYLIIFTENADIPPAVTKVIWGIFGIIRLTAGPYLIVITKKEKVGEICGHTIWKVTDTEMLSYKRTTLHLTEKQVWMICYFFVFCFLISDFFSSSVP